MARNNLFIKEGSYSGTGVAQIITGLGFKPDLLIIKGGSNAAVWKTKVMRGDLTAYLGTSTATFTGGVIALDADGFALGTDARVNAAATTYYYVALKGFSGQEYFRTGNYRGTGADDRSITVTGINFTPDFLMIASASAHQKVFTTSTMPADTTNSFGSNAATDNTIQALLADGFQLGTSTIVNSSFGGGAEYFLAALRNLTGIIKVGTYTGNGADNRSIMGVGFQPSVVILKERTGTQQARLKTTSISGDNTLRFAASATASNEIQSFESDGFQVGSASGVNTNALAYDYLALKAGSFATVTTDRVPR